jgi:hypothetical protein
MSPIALLYVLEMVLAVGAPLIAAVCIVLALVGRWQSPCRRLLLIGVVAGCLLSGLWLMTMAQQSDIIWAFGVAIFGTGFSGAILVTLAWIALRKILVNTEE